MKHGDLRVQSAWLYGVIVGLAIRESLSGVIPQITSPKHDFATWILTLEALRLVVFLVTIIRFFLGSILYFSEVHIVPKPFYGIDFLVGIVHFVMFFAWATTITDVAHREPSGLSHFGTLGTAILLYDIVWLCACWKSPNRPEIMPWTIINAVTTVCCGFVFFIPWGPDFVFKEQVAIIFVALVGTIDIAGMLSGRRFIEDAIASIFSTGEQTAAATAGIPPPQDH